MNLKERAHKLKVDIPAVFLAVSDKRTPTGARILAWITLVYALSPVDLIPDFIPVLGYLDDLIILPGLVALTVKLIPDDVLNDCRIKAADLRSEMKPKKWYYGIPFVLIWLLVIFIIIKAIWF